MAVFSYRAFRGDSELLRGTVSGDTPRHARDELRSRGLLIERMEPLKGRGRKSPFRRRHSARALEFLRELSTLLSVGTPLLSALDTVLRTQSGSFREILLTLRERVSEGRSFSEALRESPHVFDELTVSIAEVGESSGTLEVSLLRLSEFRERAAKLRGRVSGALIYPAIVFTLSIVVSILLMTVVVPSVTQPLVESGAELPWITEIVTTASEALTRGWWWLLLGVALFVALFRYALSTPRGRYVFDSLLLKVPVLGILLRKQAVVRLSVVLSTLLRSGVVFVEAIGIASRSVTNEALRRALRETEEEVLTGHSISESLAHTGVFPPTVLQVFALGEASGELEDLLDKLAENYDHQVASAAQRLTAALEPLMILFLALVVGSIALATILPILEAGNVL